MLNKVKECAVYCIVHGFVLTLHYKKETTMPEINVENLKAQMRKGMLEFCVLLILRHRPAYPYELIATLKKAHLIVVEGTLYPMLTRMKNGGMLTYEWKESQSGPPRKYYSLTPAGWQLFETLREVYAEIANSVSILSDDNYTIPTNDKEEYV